MFRSSSCEAVMNTMRLFSSLKGNLEGLRREGHEHPPRSCPAQAWLKGTAVLEKVGDGGCGHHCQASGTYSVYYLTLSTFYAVLSGQLRDLKESGRCISTL